MPELTPSERLQPCLLDRLTDDDPTNSQESRSQRVISPSQFKRAVVRDVEWLFNARSFPSADQFSDIRLNQGMRLTENPSSITPDLSQCPEAVKSVINYGVRQLCGRVAPNMPLFERELATALRTFEPRLTPQSVRIRAKIERNLVTFEIDGELRAPLCSDHLFIRTTVDLETGQCAVSEGAHG